MYKDATDIIKRSEQLFETTERCNARNLWEVIAEFILPNQSMSFYGEESPGAKRTTRVFDSTAPKSNHDLASAIHAILTNTATKWVRFSVSHPDKELEKQLLEDREVGEWLEHAANEFNNALAESNFDNEIGKSYKHFTSLGNMILMMEEKNLKEIGKFGGFTFKAWHLAEVAWSENAMGQVDEVMRKFKWDARKIYGRWGDKCPKCVKDALKENPGRTFNLLHYIYPRQDKEIKMNLAGRAINPKTMPFASLYILADESKEVIEESGYYEMPALVTRWETMPNEHYGRGPGTLALPDVRTLNTVQKLGLRAAAKAVDPPFITTQKNLLSPADLRPGGNTTVRNMEGIKPWDSNARFDVSQFVIAELQKSIQGIFFLDKLFLPDRTETGEMTAFEVARRKEELQRVLGPTFGRLQAELLNPIVRRGYKMMLRGGAFKEMPSILEDAGAGLEVEYVNSLARSQKIEELQGIHSYLQTAAMLLNAGMMEASDTVDVDGVMKIAAEVSGTPQVAVTSMKQRQEARKARAEQQQQMAMAEQALKLADAQSKASQTGPENV